MSLWRQFTRGLRAIGNRKAADQEIAEEVSNYLEEATAAFIARGHPPDEARRAARLELGSTTAVREQVRGYGWENRLDILFGDLRYAMSLPVAVTVSGIDSLDVLHQNLDVARGFQPLSAAEMQTLREAYRFEASDGHLKLFKTTKKYDGDLGREQHGFPSTAELPV